MISYLKGLVAGLLDSEATESAQQSNFRKAAVPPEERPDADNESWARTHGLNPDGTTPNHQPECNRFQ